MAFAPQSISSYKNGGLTALERISHTLEKLKNDAFNCTAELDSSALAQAEALDRSLNRDLPLFGVPILIKDNIDVKGLHTTAGSLALGDNIADEDAPIVKNLRKNGAVIVGKANMTEFANFTTAGMPGGYSSRGGQVLHPAGAGLDPLGSSTGSAAAVAAGLVPAAIGTDTSFSIIACAQANGVCGIKPPVGVLPSKGIIPISRTLDSAGPIATNFSDALRVYSAMRDEPLPELTAADLGDMKIAVNTANADIVSEKQTDFLQKILHLMKMRGTEISEICEMPTPQLPVIMRWEFRAHLEDYLRTSNASRKTLAEIVDFYEKNPEKMLKYGDTHLREALDETPGGLSGAPYLKAMKEREEIRCNVLREIEPYDAVIMTGPTYVMHLCGLPSVTVAAEKLPGDAVPRCVIMYGADELRLYRTALAIERTYQ